MTEPAEQPERSQADELLQLVPPLQSHADFLHRLLHRIPLPSVDAIGYLLQRLQQLRRLPWVSPLSSAEWPASEDLREIASHVAGSLASGRMQAYRPRTTGLTQAFEAFTALVPKGSFVPPGHDVLRSILVHALWTLESPHQTPITTLAQAIRGVSASAANPVGQLVGPVGAARSREDLARILEQTLDGQQLTDMPRGLVDMLRNYFIPNLRGDRPRVHFERERPPTEAGLKGTAKPEETAIDTPAMPEPTPATPSFGDRPHKPRGKDRKPRKQRIAGPPRGYRPHRPTLRPLRTRMRPPKGAELDASEPTSEVAPDVVLVDVGRPQSTMDHRVTLFRVSQSIRSANGLLLPEHNASLSVDEASTCTQQAIAQLQSALTGGAWHRARQWTRLLLVVLTGKATAVLASTRIYSSVEDLPANRCVIDAARGCLIQPVYRPLKPYIPTDTEQALLEPTSGHLTLPLLPCLLGAITRLRKEGADVFAAKESEWDADLVAACITLRDTTGVPAFPGRLRSSFVCALQEMGDDVAATMLIVNDTLGQSEAPLYYYTPRACDLEVIYLRAVERFSATRLQPLGCTDRVGAQTLLRTSTAKLLARALANAVHAGLRDCDGSILRLHRAVLTHTACALMTVAGHRPCSALFLLKRWDFDIDAGHAVFSDKQGDPGHFFRFVALPDLLCRQLSAYFVHLDALSERRDPLVAGRARAALDGSAPIFFDLTDAADLPRELDLAAFREMLPTEWRSVRLNHGRTLIATLGREAGIAAPVILTQLGHYEAVGFPFSKESPTRPAAFSRQIRDVLEDLAKQLDWRCVHGLQPSRQGLYREAIPPLHDWQAVERGWERHVQDRCRQAEVQRRAAEREAREQGAAVALEALSQVAPRLTDYIASKHRARVAPADVEILSDADIERVSEVLIARAEGDAILTAANLRGLAQVLASAARRFKWLGARPPYRISLPREETVPFFPGMFAALRQLDALRQWAGRGLPTDTHKNLAERELAFARVALLLLAFGYIDSEDELFGLLASRALIRRSERYPAICLVEWQQDPRRVGMVYGIAAVALGSLARRFPDAGTITPDALDRTIRQLLPEAWGEGDAPILPRLLSMVGVANRIELSPLARLALDPEEGSTTASAEEQLAWLDGTPFRAKPELSAEATLETPVIADLDRYLGKHRILSGARQDYLAVRACLPLGTGDTALPLSQLTISAVDRDRCRDLVKHELELRAADAGTHPTAMALALWTITLLEREHRGAPNALSTVGTYLSAVGGPLTSLAGEVYPGSLEEDELTELLVDTVAAGSRQPKTRARAAREVKSFAAFCSCKLGWPEVDEDEFRPFLGRLERTGADAQLLLPQQVDPVIEDMLTKVRFDSVPASDTATTRLLRQATAGLVLLRGAGARRGEVLGLRLRDVSAHRSRLVTRVAANGHRALKTRSARRTLLLGHRLSAAETAHLTAWLEAERLRLPERRRESGYLYSRLHDDKDLTFKTAVAQVIATALGEASGRGRERLHRLRHLATGESLCGIAWAECNLQLPEHWRAPLAQVPTQPGLLWPRDLRRASIAMGHAGPLTQVVHYLHLAWIFRLGSDMDARPKVTRAMVASAIGQSLNGVDRISQRRKPLDPIDAWVTHVVPTNSRPAQSMSTPSAAPMKLQDEVLSALDVTYLMDQVQEGTPLDVAAFALGGTSFGTQRVEQASMQYEDLTGYGLLVKNADRRTRQNSRSQHLYSLIDWASGTDGIDGVDLELLYKVIEVHALVAQHDREDLVAMPTEEMPELCRLLQSTGHPEDLLKISGKGPIQFLRIGRRGVDERYSGRELRRILAMLWVWRRIYLDGRVTEEVQFQNANGGV